MRSIESAAFAIYREFIRGGEGYRHRSETPDEAARRRWQDMPELSRERFRAEAAACIAAGGQGDADAR